MFKVFSILSFFVFLADMNSCDNQTETPSLKSPDGRIAVNVRITDDKRAVYSVHYNNSLVLEESRLGIVMEDEDFSQNLTLQSASRSESVKDTYSMKHGKKKEFSYSGNKAVYHFTSASGGKMDVIFQVSNDGVAFQYYFPGKSDNVRKISEEKSSFNFPEGTKAWMQPMAEAKSGWARSNPSYEEHYRQEIPAGTSSPTKAGWIFPALFKTGNTWVLISETGLERNYCATRLRQESPNGEYFIGFPQAQEVSHGGELNPQSVLPWYSPWRVVAIGSLNTIVESTLGTDLAKPAIAGDFSWVKPGRASWSWVLLKDGNTVFDVQKKFIDYAADMGWEYCLIDAVWDTQIGYDKIRELADYGKTKKVGVLLWYNSSGDWNDTPQTPKNLMTTRESRVKEFRRIKEMGIAGVKVDFFGGDGQSVIQYYHDILKDAADVGIAINFHGCTLPRGWQRTYPHLMTMEAIKGMEFVTFGQGDANAQPNHCAMIPFTRNVFDPMDFTPTAFSEVPGIKRKTSSAFELALPVLFLSGIQHYAETADGITKVPDYVRQLLKDIPVSWDETRFIDGYPGKYVIIARRSGSTWYVAGINGEETPRAVSLDLSFSGKEKGVIVTDGKDNRSFERKEVIAKSPVNVTMPGYGGFLITLKE